ncbi:MAG: choice-of-anchor Q domain-containing protein [Anaerolineae bacterium]|nr:choice-of-anchor Q domain-containing protein [Anaerolineae bacterium]
MRRETWIKLVGALATAGAALLLGQQVYAATITVTLDFDRFDDTATTGCSLREAIQTANSNAQFAGCQPSGTLGNDLIVFDTGITTVYITRTVHGGNNNNVGGDLDVYVGNVSGTLTIVGPVTVWVQGVYDRAFDVRPDGSDLGVFTLQNVTVRGGDLRIGSSVDDPSSNAQLECVLGGGGLRANSGVQVVLEGGAVRENAASYAGGGVCAREGASLILSGTQVLSNVVGFVGGQQVDWAVGGGGIWSASPLVITNGQVLHNRAVLSGGFYGFAGGGGISVVTGSLRVNGGVIADNSVVQNSTGAFEAQGGGIVALRLDAVPTDVVLDGVRVEGNRVLSAAFSYGGGVALLQGVRAVITGGTIISGNVVSATQNAHGGGLAVGLSYQPSGYVAPTLDLHDSAMRNNVAEATANAVADAITPTVFGGGGFVGHGVAFTMTQFAAVGNRVNYAGSSLTNTSGFGGGVSFFAHAGGVANAAEIRGNEVRGFRFVGGGGVHIGGDDFRLRNTTIAENHAESSSDPSAGVSGGGAYVNWGSAHFDNVRVLTNVITGTQFAAGGGVSADGTLQAVRLTARANRSRVGGGVFVNSAGLAHLDESTIASNQVSGDGGGINVDGTLFVTRTAVVSNTALQGGGIAVGGGALLHARQVTLTHNLVTGASFAQGGGLFGGGNAFVAESMIAHNRAEAPYAAGGGVYRYGGVLHLSSSTLDNNLAAGGSGGAKAGGLYLANSVGFVTNTLIARNVASATALVLGGAAWITETTLALSGVDLLTNTARSQDSVAKGGGVAQELNATLTFVGSQAVGNVARSASSEAYGGGFDVANTATLLITHSRVVSNAAIGGNNSGSGGIGNQGFVRVLTSTISRNAVLSVTSGVPVGAGGGIGSGGALHIEASSIVSNVAGTGVGLNTYGSAQTHILNSTLSGNQAGSGGVGGAILTGTARLTHTTVASNTGVGVAIGGTGLTIRATVVAHHSSNCVNWGGSVSNSDYSVSDDGSCSTFFVGTNALNNASFTRLAPLAFHAGTGTWYHPTLIGSVLHERVPVGDCPTTDQLGQPRPGVLACDTGAFELQSFFRVFAPIVRRAS